MKNLLTELSWKWDYYFVFFLYNPNKYYRYHHYMIKKWGKRYSTDEIKHL